MPTTAHFRSSIEGRDLSTGRPGGGGCLLGRAAAEVVLDAVAVKTWTDPSSVWTGKWQVNSRRGSRGRAQPASGRRSRPGRTAARLPRMIRAATCSVVMEWMPPCLAVIRPPRSGVVSRTTHGARRPSLGWIDGGATQFGLV
jgi:hypothetical protein